MTCCTKDFHLRASQLRKKTSLAFKKLLLIITVVLKRKSPCKATEILEAKAPGSFYLRTVKTIINSSILRAVRSDVRCHLSMKNRKDKSTVASIKVYKSQTSLCSRLIINPTLGITMTQRSSISIRAQ